MQQKTFWGAVQSYATGKNKDKSIKRTTLFQWPKTNVLISIIVTEKNIYICQNKFISN